MHPPVSFVFEPMSDDSGASTAGASILQVMTWGPKKQVGHEIHIHASAHVRTHGLVDYIIKLFSPQLYWFEQ